MTARQRYIADFYAFTRERFPYMMRRPAFVRRWIHKLADRSVREDRKYRMFLFRRGVAALRFWKKCSHRLNERLGQVRLEALGEKENVNTKPAESAKPVVTLESC